MKKLILVVVGIRVTGTGGASASIAGSAEPLVAAACRSARREATAHPFEFFHHLEHLDQPLRAELGDDGVPSQPEIEQPFGRQLMKCLTDRRPRDAEALGELDLVQPLTRQEAPGDDDLLQRFAN